MFPTFLLVLFLLTAGGLLSLTGLLAFKNLYITAVGIVVLVVAIVLGMGEWQW